MRKAIGPQRAAPRNEEAKIVNASLLAHGAREGVLLLVNVVKTVPNPFGPGMLTFGLGEGSPDVVGSVVSPCPGCGHPRAVPLGIEYKRPGENPEPHQARLHDAWRGLGWHIEVARSVEDTGAIIDRLRWAR